MSKNNIHLLLHKHNRPLSVPLNTERAIYLFIPLYRHKKRDPLQDLVFAWQRPTLAERKSDYHRR